MEEAEAENTAWQPRSNANGPALRVLSEPSVLRPLLRFGVMERGEERLRRMARPSMTLGPGSGHAAASCCLRIRMGSVLRLRPGVW